MDAIQPCSCGKQNWAMKSILCCIKELVTDLHSGGNLKYERPLESVDATPNTLVLRDSTYSDDG